MLYRTLSCLTGVVILWWRKPQAFTNPQLWAEDGVVFFKDAYEMGVSSLLHSYAGYYHLVPRLTALTSAAWPEYAPQFFSSVTIVAFLWVSWFLTSERMPLFNRWIIPTLIALSPVDGEAFLNLTNVQWTLAWLMIALFIVRTPHNVFERIHDLLALVFTGASSLFSIFFAPLFIARVIVERTRWNLFLAAINLGIASLQLIEFADLKRAPSVRHPIYSDLWRVLSRPFYALALGPHTVLPSEGIYYQQGWGVATVVIAVVLAITAWHSRNWPALYLLGACSLVWGAVIASIIQNPSILLGGGPRYFFLQPILIFVAVLCTPLFSRWGRGGVITAILLFFGATFQNYQEPTFEDMRWFEQCHCLRETRTQACTLRTHPEGWSFIIN